MKRQPVPVSLERLPPVQVARLVDHGMVRVHQLAVPSPPYPRGGE